MHLDIRIMKIIFLLLFLPVLIVHGATIPNLLRQTTQQSVTDLSTILTTVKPADSSTNPSVGEGTESFTEPSTTPTDDSSTTSPCEENPTITKLTASSVTVNSITIVWETNLPESCPQQYNVRWAAVGGDEKGEELHMRKKELHIFNLTPCTDYEIDVEIELPNKMKTASSQITTTTNESVDNVVVSITANGSRNASMNFQLTGKNNCKHNFIYKLKLGDTEIYSDSSPDTTLILNDLIPCSKYEILVTPLVMVGDLLLVGSEVQQELTTNYEAIEIESLKCSTSFSSVVVTFSLKEKNNCRHYYDILVTNMLTNRSTRTSTNTTNNLISNLDACTTYEVKVTVVMEDGDLKEGASLQEVFRTNYAAPSALTDFNIEPSSTMFFVTWRLPEKNLHCVNSYILKWYNTNDINEMISSMTVDNNADTWRNIENLEPCNVYNVSIEIKDDNNALLQKTSKTAKTDDEEPGTVENFEIISSKDVLKIVWNPPIIAQYCVINYVITIEERDQTCPDPSASQFLDYSQNNKDTNQCNKNIPSMDNITANDCIADKCEFVKSLKSCTYYEVTVVANGLISGVPESKSSFTEYSDPGPVQNLKLLPDAESIEVSWEPPEEHLSCLSEYHIQWKSDDMEHPEEEVTTDTSYSIQNLESCTKYSVTVSTIGKDPIVKEKYANSVTLTSTTLEKGVTEQLKYTPFVTATTIRISWDPPIKHKACIKHYRIGVYDMFAGGANIFDNEIDAAVHEIFYNYKIKACSIYNITLTPVTRNDDEDQTTYIGIETKPAVEGPPSLTLDPDSTTTKSLTFITTTTNRKLSRCKLKSVEVTCLGHTEYSWQVGKGNGSTVLEDNDKDVTTSVTVQELSPFTNYKCKAVVVNSAGRSNESKEESGKTEEDTPNEPNGGHAEVKGQEIYAKWNEPEIIPGDLQPYEVEIQFNESLFIRSCQCQEMFESYNDSTTERNIVFTNTMLQIYPYSKYTIEVNAQTGAGPGPSFGMEAITEPSAPELVRNAQYSLDTSDLSYKNVKAILWWNQPCYFNGEFVRYKIEGVGTRRGNYTDHLYEAKYIYHTYCQVLHLIERLKPEYTYEIKVSSEMRNLSREISDYDVKHTYTITTPAGIPPEIKTEELQNKVTLNVDGTDDSTRKAKIEISHTLFNHEMGQIQYVAIMVAQTACNPVPKKGIKEINEWPESKKWKDAQTEECVTYQTTEMNWNPFENLRRSNKVITFTIGEDDCEDVNDYCNGPLLPNTKYSISVRVITAQGYRDSSYIDFLTDAELALGAIIGSIFAILCIGFVVVMFMFYRNRQIPSWLKKPSELLSSPIPLPVAVKNIPLHVMQLTDNPGKLSNEFQLLGTLSVDLAMSCSVGKLPTNRKKNRYINILPYDETRVKLQCDEFGSDYVNASLIRGYSENVEYIATQGPTDDTIVDFWRMIMQYDASLIVMLTQLTENGKLKCHQYYPNSKETIEVQEMTVFCSLEIPYDSYISRTFVIQNETHQKTITQLHFTEWNDFGCPDSTHVMLQFCETMRQQCNNNNEIKGPIIIHCSAGVGRTGTLIALDILLQYIKDNRKVDVFGTVFNLRKQRVKMVQSEAQYDYLYRCIKDAVGDPSIFHSKENLSCGSMEPIYENMEVLRSASGLAGSNGSLKVQSESCM